MRVFNRIPSIAAVAAATSVLVLAGCGDKPAPGAASPEVRGQPIQSAAPAAPSATAEAVGPSTGQASASFTVTPSNTVAAGAPAASPESPPAGGTGYPVVGFDRLAGYSFDVSDDLLGPVTNNVEAIEKRTNSQIPETVRGLNQRRAAIKGFMLPLKVEGGLVTELLIMKDQSMCCYGTTPKINEWVSVKMKDKGVKPRMDEPVTLQGTLHVGEMRENGYLIGIYRMDGDSMQDPGN